MEADYRKWLGPEWKPRYDRYGIQVSNHQSYLDIFMQFVLDERVCGFIQRNGIKKTPCIGYIAEVIGGVFVKRGSTKEKRAETIRIIQERQMESEQGLRPPIHIFPEGANTNGSCILKFKKGAFASLKAVKPQCFCYWGLNANPSFGTPFAINYYAFLQVHCVLIYALRKDLPVFEPNEYFWKHHWQQGKEEKWEAFARVVRQIIHEHSVDPISPVDPKTGLGSRRAALSDCTMEDKLEYKLELKGKKGNKKE